MKKIVLLSSFIVILFWSCKSVFPVVSKHKQPDHWQAPPAVKFGDTVLYIAPAGNIVVEKAYMKRSDSLLRLWGLVPKDSPNLYQQHFVFAGTDAERFNDLQQALDDPDIKVIWCARGGYGSVRIIDSLKFDKFRRHPKWLIGFSDITVLHSVLHQQGFQSVHAIMPISLTHPTSKRELAIKSLYDFFQGKKLHYEIKSDSLNIDGRAKGVVVGGNISLLVSLLGSKYQINTDGKILFLEDVGEYTYSYDRMIYALKNAGYFAHLKGLIIGGTGVKKDDDYIGETVEQLILKHVKDKNYPVVFGFPAGHIIDNRVVIFGRKATLKVTKDKVVFEQ